MPVGDFTKANRECDIFAGHYNNKDHAEDPGKGRLYPAYSLSGSEGEDNTSSLRSRAYPQNNQTNQSHHNHYNTSQHKQRAYQQQHPLYHMPGSGAGLSDTPTSGNASDETLTETLARDRYLSLQSRPCALTRRQTNLGRVVSRAPAGFNKRERSTDSQIRSSLFASYTSKNSRESHNLTDGSWRTEAILITRVPRESSVMNLKSQDCTRLAWPHTSFERSNKAPHLMHGRRVTCPRPDEECQHNDMHYALHVFLIPQPGSHVNHPKAIVNKQTVVKLRDGRPIEWDIGNFIHGCQQRRTKLEHGTSRRFSNILTFETCASDVLLDVARDADRREIIDEYQPHVNQADNAPNE
ncbi:hypothetical protein ALC56_06267 [Trachymyrmex septentrionalis]|uniref:Uncharacterized protein n=1 Tax=Trachymyrmex septentrionalis TaxID=34720 RepID=A0A195FG51_9HYME|nr:hypothetical protein ALC56_06267 [Trachymyrmex septentrionalis]